MAFGTITASFGRQYEVELDDGELLLCVPRGKKSNLACGDRVSIAPTAKGQGVIERHEPRATLLYRSDAFREKLIAANADQVAIVVAAVPSFYDELLHRCLIAAEQQDMQAVIAFNKTDLDGADAAASRLAPLEAIGYRVVRLSARRDVNPLADCLRGRTTVLVGQSGMGKSTIVNALLGETRAATAEISTALDSGKHTTTHARVYRLDAETRLIDSPGMQEFGLHHVDAGELEYGFRELRPYRGQCKYANCSHLIEPGCAVRDALAAGRIDARRYELYCRLRRELIEAKKREFD